MTPRRIHTGGVPLTADTRAFTLNALRAEKFSGASLTLRPDPAPITTLAFTAQPATAKLPLLHEKKTASRRMPGVPAASPPGAREVRVSTRNLPSGSRGVPISPVRLDRCHRVPISARRKLTTSHSPKINDVPVSREMLNLRHVPYPQISEFIRTLAEKNKVTYTDVQLIGIYDAIPSEITSSVTLDSYSGKLRFFLKPRKGQRPRCVRMAYGRLRSTGKIIQSAFPLT
ncbi:MAG: hypothetical protein AB1742_10085 [bacterium]